MDTHDRYSQYARTKRTPVRSLRPLRLLLAAATAALTLTAALTTPLNPAPQQAGRRRTAKTSSPSPWRRVSTR